MMIFAAVNTTIAIFTQRQFFVWISLIVPVLISIVEFTHWYEILPIIAHISGSLTFFSKKIEKMRLIAPIGTLLWAFYNIIVGAWGQLAADIFILSSMIVGYARFRRDLKGKNQH